MVSAGWLDLHRTTTNIWQSFDIRNNGWVEYTMTFDWDDKITSTTEERISKVRW